MNELISVIIPLYNKEEWVKRTINSVIKQTYKNIEILIINDGSTDNSLNKVSEIQDKRIKIFTKENAGLSSARNYGIKKSSGKYIAFIDADDEWNKQILEYLINGFEKFPNSVLICSDLVEIREESNETIERRILPFKIFDNKVNYHPINNYLTTLKEGFFLLSGCSVLIKKETILKNNMIFFKDSEPAEDVNFWIRLNQLGKFIFCDYIGLKYHRIDPNSIMNVKRKEAKKIPPFFHKVNLKNYSKEELTLAKKFLLKEYMKTAYQNRNIPFKKYEFTNNTNEVNLKVIYKIIYLIIRFLPKTILKIIK